MNERSTIYVTGHRGLVGKAICRELNSQGFRNIWYADHKNTDLTNQIDVEFFFSECRPEYVFHCAAKVGGIQDNIEKPVDFMLTNLAIDSNVLGMSHRFGVKKLLFVSSAAAYPVGTCSVLSPSDLMTGPFDDTKSGYAMAKLATMQLCKEFRRQHKRNFISAIPNNIYGPGDTSTHVIPSLLRRFHEAKESGSKDVTCWGTGNARREFIFSEDLARACVFLMKGYSGEEPVNVGSNLDYTMQELAHAIADVTGFRGNIKWDPTKPEGAPRRMLNSRRINEFGWRAEVPLVEGLARTYEELTK